MSRTKRKLLVKTQLTSGEPSVKAKITLRGASPAETPFIIKGIGGDTVGTNGKFMPSIIRWAPEIFGMKR
jgi:hypothetical protein